MKLLFNDKLHSTGVILGNLILMILIFTFGSYDNYGEELNKQDLSLKQKKQFLLDNVSNEDIILKPIPERVIPFFSKRACKLYHIADANILPILYKNLHDKKKYIAAHVLLTLLTETEYSMSPSAWGGINLKQLKTNPKKIQQFVIKYWKTHKKASIRTPKRGLFIGFLKPKNKDIKTSTIRDIIKKAKNNDYESQLTLSHRYYSSIELRVFNLKKAKFWQNAAKNNKNKTINKRINYLKDEIHKHSILYKNIRPNQNDLEKLKELENKAKNDDYSSQLALSFFYLSEVIYVKGRIISIKDLKKGKFWWRKANNNANKINNKNTRFYINFIKEKLSN